MTEKYNLDFEHAIPGAEGWATTAGWVLTYQCAYDTTREYTSCYWQYCAEGVGIAAGSYTDKPAELDDNTKAIRRTADGSAWEVVDDLRGQLAYSTETGEASTVDFIGPLPDGWTLLAPASPFDKWDGDKWVTDTDAQQAAEVAAAQEKLEALNQEADRIIASLERVMKYDPTDEEKALLEAWEKYSVLLSRVDPEKPDWPEKPE
ncbi:tail fiber assembly protein [Enterobacter sp. Lyrl_3]|uniref:tail fiber assembly protein n=1 Tax=Enterobacter sp. Lyrl_3 TaxID=3110922 RepID=UPI003F7FEE90